LFQNKVVLITGGTGFLGRKLIKEILKFNPQSIRVFGRDEVKHHLVQEEFNYNEKLRNLVGDVRDLQRLTRSCEGVDIVIHAAALKRLDILEYNVDESIQTNINGTTNMVRACLDNNIKTAIFVSTDKACSPVNTYGACKFVGERIFIESNYSKGNRDSKFICVRYGNVMESTGSMIPFFEKKIRNNEDIPLTDARMSRFMITSDQAVQLIFKAIKWGSGGEIFIPKLPAIKVTDLIQILQEKHHTQVNTKIIGLRPGEKIHELMINEAEFDRTLEFDDLFIIRSNIEKYTKEYVSLIPKDETINLGKNQYFKNYSSENSIVSKDYAKDFLISIGIFC
jgi:UDP-N-acetylglucosamine 4,6-dehydratase